MTLELGSVLFGICLGLLVEFILDDIITRLINRRKRK